DVSRVSGNVRGLLVDSAQSVRSPVPKSAPETSETWLSCQLAKILTGIYEDLSLKAGPVAALAKTLITPALFSQPPPRLTGEEGEQPETNLPL
ncbi:MAG TPA: hypothetical protein VLV54_11225, partial [Thermoanaerobaculia bacterium]|nr:hypothetical protein [Thermoanaerobaculia bacterium]